jgi:hypothetical protein
MQVDAKLRLPVVLNKFLQPTTLSPEEFFPQWKALTVHSLKVQEVVRPLLNDAMEDKWSNFFFQMGLLQIIGMKYACYDYFVQRLFEHSF